tara:strand:- start:115 stop:240 length:126 start_codon:yes stop_codon:yes gene_type:complete
MTNGTGSKYFLIAFKPLLKMAVLMDKIIELIYGCLLKALSS